MYRAVFMFCVLAGAHSYISNLNTELCRREDTHCLTKVADKFYRTAIIGDPSLKMKSLDPLHQNYINGKFIFADYKLYNSTVIGFKDCHVVDTKLALEENKVNFTLVCPHIYMYGNYEFTGLIIVVPVEGNGEYTIDTKDYHIDIETGIKIIEANDGRRYLQYKNFQAFSDLRGGMSANLTNLFNGKNEELAQAAIRFINDQWKPVSREFQAPIINANIKRILKNLNKYLKSVPLDTFIIY